MKGFFANIGKNSGKLLFIVGLGPLAAACGHFIDPTQAPLQTYEMPAAVVVQTAPAFVNQNQPWQPPGVQGHAASSNRTLATSRNTPQDTEISSNPNGSTVVRQAPITIERPSIVVNQPPIWVGNPPVAIPQPPVVMHQAPITVEQPPFVIHPPKVGYQQPQQPVVATSVETKPATASEPKVTATQARAPTKAAQAKKHAKVTKKKHHKKKAGKKKARFQETDLPPK
ncbi:MAG: hypothetical protein H7839_10415 [Magnetococcus sp. YQC-5]